MAELIYNQLTITQASVNANAKGSSGYLSPFLI